MTHLFTMRPARLFMRWLLQLDKPAVERSEADLLAESYANYRWNFFFNLGDHTFFWFGMSFISASTILPLFLSKVTTQPFVFSLLAVLATSSWYLPQLFSAGAIERLARKKPVIVNLGMITERLPLLLLPLVALMSVEYPTLTIVLFFIVYAWHGFGAGIVAPAWSDLLARCFPVERRGRFFGISSFVGTGLAAIGALFSAWLLETFPFPSNFAYTFSVAAVAVTVSWFFLAQTREPVTRVSDAAQRDARLSWRKLRAILGGNKNFARFLWVRLMGNVGRMGAGFLTVAAIQQWAVADSVVGIFTALLLIGQTIGNLGAGFVADRYGHKLSLESGFLAGALAFGLAWAAPAVEWYYAVFCLLGVAEGIGIVSGVLMPLEFSQPEQRPTYVGIANTTSGIGSALGPIVGGFIAAFSYHWLFALSAILGLAALGAMHFAVREPRGSVLPPLISPIAESLRLDGSLIE